MLALPYAHLQGGVLAVPAMCLLGLWNWITARQLLEAYEALPEAETRGMPRGDRFHVASVEWQYECRHCHRKAQLRHQTVVAEVVH